jgi:protein-disulfide isomerase
LDVIQFGKALKDKTIIKRIEEDYASGLESGVNGTPSFFINGSRYEGEDDYDSLRQALIDAADTTEHKH